MAFLHVCFLLARALFCFLLLKNPCFSFRWLPFVCWSLDCICMVLDWSYYSFRGIILWFCFFSVCWLGYFVFVSFPWLRWLDCICMAFDWSYYSSRDIVFWLCFSAVYWLGYFLFGWGRCMYWLSRSTDSVILFMVCWHWWKCYCMCRLSMCWCSIFCKQNFVVFVFGPFHLFVDGCNIIPLEI